MSPVGGEGVVVGTHRGGNTGSHRLLTSILRDEWGFEGFVVSDWASIAELIPHGFAADEKDAARKEAGKAGAGAKKPAAAHRPPMRSCRSSPRCHSASICW